MHIPLILDLAAYKIFKFVLVRTIAALSRLLMLKNERFLIGV
jgi:hypothetical protein